MVDYEKTSKDYKLQFYALYEKMNSTYDSCKTETTQWFAESMQELCRMKDTLIKLQPFPLAEVDADVEY